MSYPITYDSSAGIEARILALVSSLIAEKSTPKHGLAGVESTLQAFSSVVVEVVVGVVVVVIVDMVAIDKALVLDVIFKCQEEVIYYDSIYTYV